MTLAAMSTMSTMSGSAWYQKCPGTVLLTLSEPHGNIHPMSLAD
jgi:hypothetical protein